MSFGSVTVGRLVLREALVPAPERSASSASTLTLSGQEASPPLAPREITQVQDDIRGLVGAFVPVTFTDKAGLNGYYLVTDSAADLMDWNGEVITCTWAINLTRVGSDSEVDVEARLAGPLTRVNDFGVTGERWHAPPVGHSAYWSGNTTPSTMVRSSTDGDMTVYRGVPTLTSPRYACPVDDYLAGRVRIYDLGRERVGTRWDVSPAGWELHNALVRVTVVDDALSVAAWSGNWAPKSWTLLVNDTPLGTPAGATVLRNDPECVIVRLLWSLTVGRVTCDLTLRRGARFVELFVRSSTSATIKIARTEAEVSTSATGYVRANANDGDGNRFMVGSARAVVVDLAGGISKSGATTLDAFIGAEVGGTAAVSGDRGINVYRHYLSSPAEQVRGARR